MRLLVERHLVVARPEVISLSVVFAVVLRISLHGLPDGEVGDRVVAMEPHPVRVDVDKRFSLPGDLRGCKGQAHRHE